MPKLKTAEDLIQYISVYLDTETLDKVVNDSKYLLLKDKLPPEQWREVRKVIFWDIAKPLSYQALFNFIVGNRGGGKTYGAKEHVIKRFLKTGEQFIYLRRYKDEQSDVKTWFNDIAEEFPDAEFKVKGNKEFYINGELAGYALVLSTAKIKKSVPYPKVKTIVFDEFIIDKGVYKYLHDEVTCFLEFYETIARTRDVQVFFLSNAITITNPYFLYFNLRMPYNSDISCKDDKLVQLVANPFFIDMKKNTRFGRLISGTAYGDYAIENTFLRDDKTFIEKKTGNCSFVFSMIYKDHKLGVWRSYADGKFWVSSDVENYRSEYALTKADHSPNTMLLTSLRQSNAFKMFTDAFQNGYLFFETMNIKNICFEIMKMYFRY